MSNSHTNYLSLSKAIWPELEIGYGRKLLLAVAGTIVLAISAKIQIPFYPVPMTMQTLVVIMIGALFGARLGMATILLYLAEGFMGLPVFAGPVAGPAYLAGPTAGYLFGFVLAAGLAGALAERGWDRKIHTTFALMLLSTALIFIPGVAWLAILIGLPLAIAKGLVPFLLGGLLKASLATAILPMAWKLMK